MGAFDLIPERQYQQKQRLDRAVGGHREGGRVHSKSVSETLSQRQFVNHVPKTDDAEPGAGAQVA